MTDPSLSVLLPLYNAGLYLEPQIRSILEQGFQDFELLVIDDGSSDQSVDIVHALAREDARIRLLPSTGNAGQKARLLELVGRSVGRLISFADQDDIWDRCKLQRLVDALGDRAVAFGPSHIIDGEGNRQGMTLLDMAPPAPGPDDRLIYLIKPMVSAHAMIVRADRVDPVAFRRTHPFDWLISLDAMFSDGVVYVPEAITYHRIHATNQSNGRMGREVGFLERYSAFELRRKYNVRTAQRWMTLQRLEHLAMSPIIDDGSRARFKMAHALCARHWFDEDRPLGFYDAVLHKRLDELLLPLATDAERHYVAVRIRRLCQATNHPINLIEQMGSLVRGGRKPK